MNSQANGVTSQVKAMMAQVNLKVGPHVPQHSSTMESRLRVFTRMNPPMFHRSKAEEDPQDFLYEVYKILFVMGVTTDEKAELAAYQLKDVEKTCYALCRDNRFLRGGPVTCEIFKRDFLDQFFPRELRESKV